MAFATDDDAAATVADIAAAVLCHVQYCVTVFYCRVLLSEFDLFEPRYRLEKALLCSSTTLQFRNAKVNKMD